MKIPWNRAARELAMAAILGTAAWPALAQYGHMLSPGMSFKSPVAALADFNVHQMMQRSAQTKALLARLEGAGSAAPSAAQPDLTVAVAAAQPLSATDFRPTGPRRVAEVMVAEVADPAERARTLAALREQQAAIEAVPGFRRNNLACALTLLVGTSLQVLSGREIDDAQSDALLQAVNDALVASGAMARLDARRRTEAYDTLLITAALIGSLARGTADGGSAAQAESAKAFARAALAALGWRG